MSSIWSHSGLPAGAAVETGDTSTYTLGTVIQSTVDGTIDAIWYYRTGSEPAGFNAGRNGGIWNADGSTLLASGASGAESGSGWRSITISPALAVTAGTNYVVGVQANTYIQQAGGLTSEVASGDIKAPASAAAGGNGRFKETATLAYPGETYGGNCYFIDVTFTAGGAAVAPSNTALPAITGSGAIGAVHTGSTGTWSGTPTPTYAYQWKLDGANVSGATGTTYTPVAGDAGKMLTVTVTATNSAGSASATSAAVGPLAVVAPANTALPAISGAPTVGTALSATSGSWSGSPATYTYQWKRSGGAISGATGATYTLGTADLGATITVTVTATNSAGSASATSTATATVTDTPVATGGSSVWLGNPPWTFAKDGSGNPIGAVVTGDATVYTLGTAIKSKQPGKATGIRYWRTGSEAGAFASGRSVGLYSAAGTLLASGTSTAGDETGSGWREVIFATPVTLTIGTTYIVAAQAKTYPLSTGYFASGSPGFGGIDSPDSTLTATGGRTVTGGTLAYPSTANNNAYAVDLIFQEDVPTSSGVVKYVATTGNDSTGNGSAGTPWKTINKAMGLAGRGDEIVVADGTYNESISFADMRGVTLRAANPGMANLRSSSGNAVSGGNAAWCVLDGFDIRTTAANCHGVEIENSHHLTIKRCCSHDNPNSGISVPWSCDVTVEDCITYGNGRAGWYSGITLYQSRNITGSKATYADGPRNIVRRCVSYDNWTTGGSTDGNGILIDDGNHTQSYGPNPDGWLGVEFAGGYLVENCITYGNGNKGVGVAWSNQVIVRNNTTYCNNIDGSQGSWRGDLSNQSGANNTFINNVAVCSNASSFGTGGTVTSNTAIGNYGTSTDPGYTCAGTVWYNNLTYNLNTPASTSLNITGGAATTPTSGNGNLLARNPLFANAAGTVSVNLNGLVRTIKDLRLQSSSTAINAGSSLYGLPATDIIGNARVSGAAVDMGVYEYQEAGGGGTGATIPGATLALGLSLVPGAFSATSNPLPPPPTPTDPLGGQRLGGTDDGADLLGWADGVQLLAWTGAPIQGQLDPSAHPLGGPVSDRVYLVTATLYPNWTDQTSATAVATTPAIADHPIADTPFAATSSGPPPAELRLADQDFVSRDDDPDLPSVWFDGRVIDAGSISVSLPLVPVGSSAIETAIGSVVIDNADGAFDTVLDQSAAVSQSVRISGGRHGFHVGDFVTIFNARVTGIGMTEADVTLELQDPALYAQNLYPTTVYTGLGGIGGDAELAGVVRPVALGRIWNMSPVLINAVSLIYQAHDGAITAVLGVYDGGVPLTFTSDYASYAALAAASLSGGQYATCLASGLIRVGGTPAYALTAYVDGESAAGNTLKSLATWLFGQFRDALEIEIDASTLTALPDWVAGWMWSETFTFADAISRFVGDAGFSWGADSEGRVRVLQLTAPGAPTIAYDQSDVMQLERAPMPDGYEAIHQRRQVRYLRNWTVQDDSALAATASSRAARQREWKTALSTVAIAARNTIDPAVIETSLASATDAATLGAALLALHGTARRMFALDTKVFGPLPRLGDTVTVRYPRFGLADATPFRVVGIDTRLESSAIHLLLWG